MDANFFLRALTRSPLLETQRMHQIAGDLMRRAERGEVALTTSNAVIAEVAFILTSKAHYNLTVADAGGRLAALLRMRGFTPSVKRVPLLALEIWVVNPKLGFVDALTAAYVSRPGLELASFDTDFDQFPQITRWRPPPGNAR